MKKLSLVGLALAIVLPATSALAFEIPDLSALSALQRAHARLSEARTEGDCRDLYRSFEWRNTMGPSERRAKRALCIEMAARKANEVEVATQR